VDARSDIHPAIQQSPSGGPRRSRAVSSSGTGLVQAAVRIHPAGKFQPS